MEDKCFECEIAEDLQQHHVVPRSRGGTKTVTLCYSCHMKAHGRDSKGLNMSRLTKEALARLKEQGVQLGNLESLNKHRAKGTATMKARGQANVSKYSPIVKAILADGPLSVRKVAKRLEDMGVKTPQGKTKWSYAMTQKIMKRLKQEE